MFNDETAHDSEIIYLGQPPFNISRDFEWYPWNEYDMTRNVYLHHIDNSAGHPHSELVDCKMGAHDVTIEYCTDGAGSQNNEPWEPASVGVRGHDITVRWCRLQDGTGHGLVLPDERAYDLELSRLEPAKAYERAGTRNSIYGNEITGFAGNAVHVPQWIDGDPPEQDHVCGNEVDGSTSLRPETPCSGGVPDGDGVGHLGGDSPWS